MFKLMDKKILTFYAQKFSLSRPTFIFYYLLSHIANALMLNHWLNMKVASLEGDKNLGNVMQ